MAIRCLKAVKKKRISLAGPFTLILTAVFLQKVKLNGNKILLHLI